MEWCKRYILPTLACLSLVIGVWLAIHFPDQSGSPDTSWIQVGASLSLIIITFQYVRITQSTLEESRASRISSEDSLEELREARMDSLRPALSIGHLIKNKSTGSVQGKCKTTSLVNNGLGLAISIKVFSTLKYQPDEHEKYHWFYSNMIAPWPPQLNSFGVPLGPDNGNTDMQIEFFVKKISPLGYSPVEDPKVVFLIEYKDSFGRRFCTTQKKCQQNVYGPISPEELRRIRNQLDGVCQLLPEGDPVNTFV